MVRSEGNVSLKNPVTPPGIDAGTFRLVAKRLNHYATPGPTNYSNCVNNIIIIHDLGPEIQQLLRINSVTSLNSVPVTIYFRIAKTSILMVKVKGKFVPVQTIKVCGEIVYICTNS